MSLSSLSLLREEDPVPAEARSAIELFASQLAKVSFPDADEVSLRRDVEGLCAEAKLVTRAREALEAAVASLEMRRRALKSSAARAIAYAKIYSEAHPDRVALASALAELANSPAPSPPAKRRGRPPRRSADLFDTTTLPPPIEHAALAISGTCGRPPVEHGVVRSPDDLEAIAERDRRANGIPPSDGELAAFRRIGLP
ncbi:hypothetical protein BH11MYX1_BH11MYX1_57470 [soil metagenome]